MEGLTLTFSSNHSLSLFLFATENNATLYCYANGTWSSRSFYDYCLNAITNPPGTHVGTSISTIQTTFYVGNSLSLAAVALALWIFISFK